MLCAPTLALSSQGVVYSDAKRCICTEKESKGSLGSDPGFLPWGRIELAGFPHPTLLTSSSVDIGSPSGNWSIVIWVFFHFIFAGSFHPSAWNAHFLYNGRTLDTVRSQGGCRCVSSSDFVSLRSNFPQCSIGGENGKK